MGMMGSHRIQVIQVRKKGVIVPSNMSKMNGGNVHM